MQRNSGATLTPCPKAPLPAPANRLPATCYLGWLLEDELESGLVLLPVLLLLLPGELEAPEESELPLDELVPLSEVAPP